ncbi:hypothetical protein L0222_01250 [bacterium]|nr:hypothetical protein [bacterium]MCI0604402.1 hypothetical protein [bacterium]
MQVNFLRRLLYLFVILLFTQPAFAQRLVARKLFDHARAIRVIGETAYVVSGSGLFIYDITDRAHPNLLSSLLINNNSSFDLEVSPPHAYVLSGEVHFENSTITVVNIANRAKPVIVSQYQDFTGTQAKDFILRGETLIVSNANHLDFLTVSDPREIRKITSLHVTPEGGTIQSFTRDGFVLYASYRYLNRSGVVAVDTVNRRNPKILSRIKYAGNDKDRPVPISLAVSNHVLYVGRNGQKISFYDVSNPANLKSSGTLSVTAFGLMAESNFLFAQTSDQKVAVYDITTPLSPRLVREVEWSGSTTGMDFDPVQLNAFVQWTELGRSGFAILKFKNDGTYEVQSSKPSVYGSDVEEKDGVTFITGSNKLASVERVPGRKDVRELGNIAFFELLGSMEIRNSRAYISTVDSESKPGIRIVDVSDPAHMQELGYLELDAAEVPPETSQPRFDVQQNVMVLALKKTGLAIYNVSNGAFQHVSTFQTPAKELSLNATIRDGIAFLCTSRLNADTPNNELNLYTIDVQNPARPKMIAKFRNFDTGDIINDLKVDGSFLYIAGAERGSLQRQHGSGKLYIFSIETPEKPVLLSKTFTGSGPQSKSGDAEEIKIQSDVAYLADGVDGITIFDLSDKSNPIRVGTLNTPSLARGVSLDDQNQIHVADSVCYLLFR